MRLNSKFPHVLLACLAACAASGCSDGGATHVIDQTRALDHARADQAMPLDTKARMGLADDGVHGGFRHPPMGGAESPAAVPAASESDFAWSAPEGWTQGAAKQMRLVTFVPKDAAGVECYVTVLSGTGGGMEANINRWRQQLKLAPLSADAIAALSTIDVLGRTARMVEIDGGSVGMLGLVCELGPQSVFVKMTGPMEALRAQRDRFVEFCKSLSQN